MSIRPIDLQVMVTRTTEITRAQANEGTRPEVSQQQFANQLQKEALLKQQSVVSTNKSDEKQKINADDDNKNKQKREQKKRKEQEEKKSGTNAGVTNNDGSLIDISV